MAHASLDSDRTFFVARLPRSSFTKVMTPYVEAPVCRSSRMSGAKSGSEVNRGV